MSDITLPLLRTPAEGVAYLYKVEKEIKSLEAQLEEAKARHRRVETEALPALYDNADVTEIETPEGVRAKKSLYIEGSLPKPNDDDTPEEAQAKAMRRERGIAWAMTPEVGWGPFVKRTVTLAFDKGDEEGADKVLAFVRGFNTHQPTIKVDEGIHAQTLQSQARKRLESGLSLPLDDLGLVALTGVKITKRPKS